jgi:hypothetical protein
VVEGEQSGTYLSSQNNGDEEETNVRAIHAKYGLEWKLVEGVAVIRPRFPEADMGETDGTPSEQGRQTRQSLKPGKDRRARRRKTDIGEGAKEQDKTDRG